MYRRTKKKHGVTFFITDVSVVRGSNFVGGTGSESVLSTPLRFTPSCAKSPDDEIEYLRTLAKVIARGRGRVARPPSPAPAQVQLDDQQRASGHRVGSSTCRNSGY